MTDTDTIRAALQQANDLRLFCELENLDSDDLLHAIPRTLDALIAEVRELRRILYAAVDPESGATSAQDVRDLIQGELNAIATTPKEVTDPGAVDEGRPAPGSLTSFGADDWATVEQDAREWTLPTPDEVCGILRDDWKQPATAAVRDEGRRHIERLLAENERLRAADQAKTEALQEAREYVCQWPIGTSDEPQEQRGGPRDTMIRNIDAALAADRETAADVRHQQERAAAWEAGEAEPDDPDGPDGFTRTRVKPGLE